MDVKDAILSRRSIFKFKQETRAERCNRTNFQLRNMGIESPYHRTVAVDCN